MFDKVLSTPMLCRLFFQFTFSKRQNESKATEKRVIKRNYIVRSHACSTFILPAKQLQFQPQFLYVDVVLTHSGEEATTNFSTTSIKSFAIRNGTVISNHMIENVSFASIGEQVSSQQAFTYSKLQQKRQNKV